MICGGLWQHDVCSFCAERPMYPPPPAPLPPQLHLPISKAWLSKCAYCAGASGSMTPPASALTAPSTPRHQPPQPLTPTAAAALSKSSQQSAPSTSQAEPSSAAAANTSQASRLFPKAAATPTPQPSQRPSASGMDCPMLKAQVAHPQIVLI